MKKTGISIVFIGTFLLGFSQKNKEKKLSEKEAQEVLNQIHFDSSKFVSESAKRSCACIDSILTVNKNGDENNKEIAECIDKEVVILQMSIQMLASLNGKSNTIVIDENKKSNKYKRYYYLIEEWLKDSCKSLNKAVAANNKESDFSFSKDTNALNQYYIGVDFLKVENYKEALPYFKAAVGIDKKFAFAWDNIGICFRHLDNYDSAIVAYNKSLEIDPNGKTPLQNLAVAYEFQKKYDKAIDVYYKISAADKTDPEAFYGLARMYIFKDENEKGLDYACKAYQLYVAINSPYRVDAQKIMQEQYQNFKAQNKEATFYKILEQNNISVNKK